MCLTLLGRRRVVTEKKRVTPCLSVGSLIGDSIETWKGSQIMTDLGLLRWLGR